jgi:hypothetical protein
MQMPFSARKTLAANSASHLTGTVWNHWFAWPLFLLVLTVLVVSTGALAAIDTENLTGDKRCFAGGQVNDGLGFARFNTIFT